MSLCQTPVEDVKLALYRVRSRIWNSQCADAMRLLMDVLKRVGYDPDRPELLRLKVPRTTAEVSTFVENLRDVPFDEESDVRILLSTLICKFNHGILLIFVGASGSTIFVALPNHWITIFSLGVTLMGEVGIVQETSAYLLSVYALSVPDVPVRQALCDYAYTLASARLGSAYSCTAILGIAAQVHVSNRFPVYADLTCLVLVTVGACSNGHGASL